MQTAVPTLPVVNSSKISNRKEDLYTKNIPLEIKNYSPGRNIISNKRCLCPFLGGPYRNNNKQYSPLDQTKPSNKSVIGQRIMSAKMLRFKQLQNQLADAHYHLNELTNENRLLKALQKRQDSALRRYEGTNAELPRIINSHHEELRVLQTKYKKLKALHKETCSTLKEKENELQSLQSQNKHLLQLSKDRNLKEREKLQLQVSDLNYRVQQQQDVIQILRKKLTLESKSLKHQLRTEVTKRKEAEKNLQETMGKLKNLEQLLDSSERRLYLNGQITVHNRGKILGSQSLVNLRDISASSPLKPSNREKRYDHILENNLPILNASETNDNEKSEKVSTSTNLDQESDLFKTETMTSLQKVRKFRLQKSPYTHRNISLLDEYRKENTEVKTKMDSNEKIPYREKLEDTDNVLAQVNFKHNENNESIDGIIEDRKNENAYKLSKELKTEFYYSPDTESEHDSEHCELGYQIISSAKQSRELHARLISSVDDTLCVNSNTEEPTILQNGEKDFEKHLSKNNPFPNNKDKKKSNVLYCKTKYIYESDSELESQMKLKKNMNKNLETVLSEYNADLIPNSTNFSVVNPKITRDQIINNQTVIDIKFEESNDSEIKQNSTEVSPDLLNVKTDSQDAVEGKELLRENLDYTVLDRNSLLEIMKQENMINKGDLNPSKEYMNLKKKEFNNERNSQELSTDQLTEVGFLSAVEFRTGNSESLPEHINKNNCSIYNKENQSYDEIEHNEDTDSIEVKNKLNIVQQETVINDKKYLSHTNEQDCNLSEENHAINVDNATKATKVINYNKEKLLATMKAIDNNENIEYLNQEFQKHNLNRAQITENLYRGLPTHTKRKQDIIKDMFSSDSIDNKPRSSCSKLH